MTEIVPTVVGEDARFEGVLTFRGAARVEGGLEGEIVGEGRLILGPRAKVRARIEVDELVVAGSVEGEVTVRTRVELLGGARLSGKLSTPRLSVADGAHLAADCRMGRARGPAPRPRTDTSREGTPAPGAQEAPAPAQTPGESARTA